MNVLTFNEMQLLASCGWMFSSYNRPVKPAEDVIDLPADLLRSLRCIFATYLRAAVLEELLKCAQLNSGM